VHAAHQSQGGLTFVLDDLHSDRRASRLSLLSVNEASLLETAILQVFDEDALLDFLLPCRQCGG
jgi:hypothetical protein